MLSKVLSSQQMVSELMVVCGKRCKLKKVHFADGTGTCGPPQQMVSDLPMVCDKCGKLKQVGQVTPHNNLGISITKLSPNP